MYIPTIGSSLSRSSSTTVETVHYPMTSAMTMTSNPVAETALSAEAKYWSEPANTWEVPSWSEPANTWTQPAWSEPANTWTSAPTVTSWVPSWTPSSTSWASPTSSTSPDSSFFGKPNGPLIAGVVFGTLGSLLFLFMILMLTKGKIVRWCRRRNGVEEPHHEMQPQPTQNPYGGRCLPNCQSVLVHNINTLEQEFHNYMNRIYLPTGPTITPPIPLIHRKPSEANYLPEHPSTKFSYQVLHTGPTYYNPPYPKNINASNYLPERNGQVLNSFTNIQTFTNQTRTP
ncbi:hypothetical protein HYFRA_00003088 [Hymenoscyphus fraxineus]|uniref:Uncharacterized protein n=1 Tax=Hymenoscyphus fraxineus TaxID=746836 RepID=A0A9N9PL99_9HELO|nr:hypothetical protein HYFRA_00003088 [Hymenoscyphus fraxineus]